MPVSLTICSTCKFAPGRAFGPDGASGGQTLLAAVREAARNRPAPPTIASHECLWSCSQSVSVMIAGPGKPGYLAGRFVPGPEAAQALLDWCDAYGQSPDGAVPFRQWPAGMKGHFIARIPGSGVAGAVGVDNEGSQS